MAQVILCFFVSLILFCFMIFYLLRYTFFIVAYPVGVSGELLVSYAGLDYAKSKGVFSIDLPNKLNFTFNFYLIMIFVMLIYIPLFPPMYFHMFGQRKKVLGAPATKKDQ